MAQMMPAPSPQMAQALGLPQMMGQARWIGMEWLCVCNQSGHLDKEIRGSRSVALRDPTIFCSNIYIYNYTYTYIYYMYIYIYFLNFLEDSLELFSLDHQTDCGRIAAPEPQTEGQPNGKKRHSGGPRKMFGAQWQAACAAVFHAVECRWVFCSSFMWPR